MTEVSRKERPRDSSLREDVPEDVKKEILHLRWERTTQGFDLVDVKTELADTQRKLVDAETRLATANQTIRETNKRISGLNGPSRAIADQDPSGYYRVLGLHPESLTGISEEDAERRLKSAYRASSFIHHSDRGGSDNGMKLLNEAMEHLADPLKRRGYGK